MNTVCGHTRLQTLAAIFRSCGLGLFLLLAAAPALAASVTLAWDPPAGPVPAGYVVYYGPAAGNYPSKIDVGNVATYTVPNLTAGSTYHFAATDYDATHSESGFSNDISVTIPVSPPVASFTASTTSGVAPVSLNFVNSSTGTITTYAWTFGDGTTSTAANPTHLYNVAGVYTVSLTVTGPGGSNTQTRTGYVTITAPSGAPVSVGAVSRKTHGAAGVFDLQLSTVVLNPTTEPRLGPAQQIVFQFNKTVTGGVATVTAGTAVVGTTSFAGNQMTVNLTGVANAQYVTVTATSVTAADGGIGGTASIRVGYLAGDVNQSRVVTFSDLVLVNAQLARPVTAATFLLDVNASGSLTFSDMTVVNANLARSLPAP